MLTGYHLFHLFILSKIGLKWSIFNIGWMSIIYIMGKKVVLYFDLRPSPKNAIPR